jgi:hypothetical protein
MKEIGKLLMLGGGILLLAGFFVWIGGDKLKWFGNLPGDIHLKRPGFSLYVPLTSMILLSIVLSVIIWVFRKFL